MKTGIQGLPTGRSVWLASLCLCAGLLSSQGVTAGGDDDPLLAKVMLDQLELRDTKHGTARVLEAEAWIGKDLQKLWLKADLERLDSETEEAELQVLFSRAVAPYWDVQLGLQKTFQPRPDRSWVVLGMQGLAPYFLETDAALLLGESGRLGLNASVEKELLFTQRLVLAPEVELNAYAQNDADHHLGSGLSNIQAGLRLRYEIRREFAPYIGMNWFRKFGGTEDHARAAGEPVRDAQLVIGLRAWF